MPSCTCRRWLGARATSTAIPNAEHRSGSVGDRKFGLCDSVVGSVCGMSPSRAPHAFCGARVGRVRHRGVSPGPRCVCVCACVCVRACVRACVCACACVRACALALSHTRVSVDVRMDPALQGAGCHPQSLGKFCTTARRARLQKWTIDVVCRGCTHRLLAVRSSEVKRSRWARSRSRGRRAPSRPRPAQTLSPRRARFALRQTRGTSHSPRMLWCAATRISWRATRPSPSTYWSRGRAPGRRPRHQHRARRAVS
jgi:hypothetical protein